MWFLIKGTFWFTLVLVVLSFIGGNQSSQSASNSQFQLSNAITAATGTYDYLSGLCSTKPDVCIKGAQTLSAIGERAREGALVAYQLINNHLGNGADASATADASPANVAPTNVGPAAGKEAGSAADHVVTGSVPHPTVINIPKPRSKPTE
ncbi:DUF5330 domain-containing protein [Rhizobium sp.]|uniref:DUF5330 domain-containing protein n=1 Tax=Rhizobium sp. TaxID=391 RepID=UPI000E9F4F9A|nr:hypothetical protein [Rhizobium sp.]